MRTFFPKTVNGIQEIIRMAGKEGARVRASGIRHTTTPWIWGVDNSHQPQPGHTLEYVIAMLPQEGRLYHINNNFYSNLIAYSSDCIFLVCIFGIKILQ